MCHRRHRSDGEELCSIERWKRYGEPHLYRIGLGARRDFSHVPPLGEVLLAISPLLSIISLTPSILRTPVCPSIPVHASRAC
jgi:hypothetical protein